MPGRCLREPAGPNARQFVQMLELIALAGLFIAGLAVGRGRRGVPGLEGRLLGGLFPDPAAVQAAVDSLWRHRRTDRGAFTLAAGAALLPILLAVGLIVAVLGAIAAVLALVVPAIPFILLGLAIWAFMRRPSLQSTVGR